LVVICPIPIMLYLLLYPHCYTIEIVASLGGNPSLRGP
jgi:hypothetical protein